MALFSFGLGAKDLKAGEVAERTMSMEEEEEEVVEGEEGGGGVYGGGSCSQGHRSSLILETRQGGRICLICLTNLLSNPSSPTLHVSHALSQLSHALSHPPFLHSLLSFHPHLLVSPLLLSLSSFDDHSIASHIIHLVLLLSRSSSSSLYSEFVSRITSILSGAKLHWTPRQAYMLHCLGVLLNCEKENPYAYIKDKSALVFNLVAGLQLPSEEIQGEILFVLYKLSILQYASEEDDERDPLFSFCPRLLRLSMEALMKTQSDDVRSNCGVIINCLYCGSNQITETLHAICDMNGNGKHSCTDTRIPFIYMFTPMTIPSFSCVALLTVLAQRGYFENAFANDRSIRDCCEADNFMEVTEHEKDVLPLTILFAEAIKGPLLASDSQLQLGSLELIFHLLTWERGSSKQIQVLVEENIVDYVFEILRLSECKDPVVSSCIRVLDLLSTAEHAFGQRLAIGFTTLVPVLQYVVEVPFHPVQTPTLKLIQHCILNYPGIVSIAQLEEIGHILTRMLRRHIDGDIDMLPETLIIACTILVDLMKSPSSHEALSFVTIVQESVRPAILSSLCLYEKHPNQILHSLYFLKEAYAFSHEGNSTNDKANLELGNCIIDVCRTSLVPWFAATLCKMEDEEIVLGVLEAFHSVLLQDSFVQAKEFVMILVSSSWFSLSFGCLGLFPSEKMKYRVYLMFSSIVDVLLENDSGQPIRDAALYLPSDPSDLLFLLGQKSTENIELLSCQAAVLLLLYTSSLYDERFADEKLILASLEQYIIVNCSDFPCRAADSATIVQLMNLYSLYRGLAEKGYRIPYSPEAERILFELLIQNEWNLSSAMIHSISLKWLFQQGKIIKPLSYQILKFCRNNCSSGSPIIIHRNNSRCMDVHELAKLVASGDNLGAALMVYLLQQLIEEDGNEGDIISVVNLMVDIINIFPAASDHLCMHHIGNGIQDLFSRSIPSLSQQMFVAIEILIFDILWSVQPETLSDGGTWHAVTLKLMGYLNPMVTRDGWTQESLFLLGIYSLILHHSTNQTLVEASKAVLMSASLVSMINDVIHTSCSKGPALIDDDEETRDGETLIFVLLLHFFSCRSYNAVLPGSVDWPNLLDPSNRNQPLSLISIHCHDLCRLMHFGCPLVKLIASYCLLELFTRITCLTNGEQDEIKLKIGDLLSVMTVLEGLIFYSDIRVAMNCALCLSVILGWEKFGMQDPKVIGRSNWCRLIVEELAMSLAVPCLASNSFMNHYKPAVHVAVALLNLHSVPGWMKSVFDDSCISGIIENLSVSNVSLETVLLFRELLNHEYLKDEQVAGLNRVFQACRKHIYSSGNAQEESREENREKAAAAMPNDLGKACQSLIRLMSSNSSAHKENRGLLEEIEMFSKCPTQRNDG